VDYTQKNWGEKVREFTRGKGVDCIFEMVGGEVYNESLTCITQGGQVIVYGCASGVQGRIHP
jgi:NADPH2:quinone reductase